MFAYISFWVEGHTAGVQLFGAVLLNTHELLIKEMMSTIQIQKAWFSPSASLDSNPVS
jgi:hypothetical protein